MPCPPRLLTFWPLSRVPCLTSFWKSQLFCYPVGNHAARAGWCCDNIDPYSLSHWSKKLYRYELTIIPCLNWGIKVSRLGLCVSFLELSLQSIMDWVGLFCFVLFCFKRFYCCSSTAICIFPQIYPHPSHRHLPPLIPSPLDFIHVSFIVVPENPSPSPPHYPLSSGYCRIVLNFNVSGYILLDCLFCWLGSP